MKRYLIGAALVLAGCAGGPMSGSVVHHQNVDPYYSLNEAGMLAAAGGPVVVLGAPADGASPEAVAATIRMPPYIGGGPMTAGEASSGRRLVLVFAPTRGASSEMACAGEAAGGVSKGRLKVLAVFCSGRARAITEGILEVDGEPVPGDPRFEASMSQLMHVLFPPVSPRDREDKGCNRVPGC